MHQLQLMYLLTQQQQLGVTLRAASAAGQVNGHPVTHHHHHTTTTCCCIRGDIVRLETYFSEDGRLASRRDWRIIDVATGELLGAATRCVCVCGGGGWMGVCKV
jgi:hypothetical protein